jgi:Phage tail protein
MSELYEWVDPTGVAFALSGGADGVEVLRGVMGRFMPPQRRTADIVPLQPGERLRSILHGARDTSLPLAFQASSERDLRSLIRAWLVRFDPARGDGILRITGEDAGVRELTCRYLSGLEADESDQNRYPGKQLAVVTFTAADPYWGGADSEQTWGGGPPTTFFPFFPLLLGISQIFGASTVTNVGDVATYPVWVITGPGSLLTLSNLTTGRSLAWNGTLGAGEFLVIDCRGGNQSASPKSVTKSDGSDQFGLLSAWDFWPFDPADNEVEVLLTGATTGASQVITLWRSMYLGA